MQGHVIATTEVPIEILKIRRFSVTVLVNGEKKKMKKGDTLIVEGKIDYKMSSQ